MRIEHLAVNVNNPVKLAEWYVRHLGLRILRQAGSGYFLGDDGGRTVLEVYHNPAAPVADFAAWPPPTFHIALNAEDVAAERQRLIAAGGRADGEVSVSGAGDTLAIVRDPAGIALQLIHRRTPLQHQTTGAIDKS